MSCSLRRNEIIYLFSNDEKIRRLCAEVQLKREDIVLLPSISDIVSDSSLTSPEDVEDRWIVVRDQCQKEAVEFSNRVRRELAGLFMGATGIGRATYQKIKDDIAKGDLPPSAEIAYERNLLSSPCAIFTCARPDCRGRHKLEYPALLSESHLGRGWVPDCVRVEPVDVKFCRKLMETLELPIMDPDREGWLTCRSCIDDIVRGGGCLKTGVWPDGYSWTGLVSTVFDKVKPLAYGVLLT